jgi:hypothetical protein
MPLRATSASTYSDVRYVLGRTVHVPVTDSDPDAYDSRDRAGPDADANPLDAAELVA